MVAAKEYINQIVCSNLGDDTEESSLVSIIKNAVEVFQIMSADQDTVNKKWKTLYNSKAKFTLNNQKVITSDSITFL